MAAALLPIRCALFRIPPEAAPGRHEGRHASHSLQFIEHGSHIPRHADLIGCGMAGLSLLDGALDVNGEGVAAGRPRRIRQAPDGPHRTDDDRLLLIDVRVPSVPLANLIGAISSCRPPNRCYGKQRVGEGL
jgi:hypothetical protein